LFNDDRLVSAMFATVRDPEAVLRMPPSDFLRFLEDIIVSGLMSPVWPKLVAQLIGAIASHPSCLQPTAAAPSSPGGNAISCNRKRAVGWRHQDAAARSGNPAGRAGWRHSAPAYFPNPPAERRNGTSVGKAVDQVGLTDQEDDLHASELP
jgi:hypothetical protein